MDRGAASNASEPNPPAFEGPATGPPTSLVSLQMSEANDVASANLISTLTNKDGDERLTEGALIAGRYRIEAWLGRGGMGTVYRAHDLHNDRTVALKLLHRALLRNDQQLKRFRREARLLSRLRSPHIVAIYDHGQTDEGTLYLAMEYLEGETLEAKLKNCQTIEVSYAIKIAISVLNGLAVVHRTGIVHRDVKPANIFLARMPDGRQVVKLLDFGVAKTNVAETTDLTAAGMICGTPRYMSPEQMFEQIVDPRADLFSVGVVLYRALTGEMPFESDTPALLAYSLTQSSPPPLSRRRPTLSEHTDLNRMVLHALARSPAARYQSAHEMEAELRTLLPQGETQTQSQRAQWWPTRFTAPTVRAAVVALLVIATIPLLELVHATQAPLAGFAMSGLLVSPILPPEWQGYGTVAMYDEILAIDGQRLRSASQGRAYLASLPEGTPVTYLLQRGDRQFTAVMYLMHPTWSSLRRNYGMLHITGLLLILVGAIVAWSRPHLTEARALLAMTGALGLLFLLARSRDFGGRLDSVWAIAAGGAGVGCIHLALVYPARWAPLRRHPWGVGLVYAFGGLITGLVHIADTTPLIASNCMRAVAAWDVAGMLILLIRLAWLRSYGHTVVVRQAARQLLWAARIGLGITVLMGATVAITGRISNESYQAVVVAFVSFPLAIGYQIRRGQLFDLDLLFVRLQRGLLRYMLLVVIFAAAGGFGLMLMRLLQMDVTAQIIAASLCGITAISLAYEPLVRRLFSVTTHDDSVDSALIARFSNSLLGMGSSIDVVDMLVETLQQCYQPSGLRLLEREGSGYLVRALNRDEITRSAVLADVMPATQSGDTSAHLQQPLTAADVQLHLSHFGRMRAYGELVLPVVAGDLTGCAADGYHRVLVLGPRGDGRPYTGSDSDVIGTLVHLTAVRLELLDGISSSHSFDNS